MKLALSFVLAGLVACAGATPDPITGPGKGSGGAAGKAGGPAPAGDAQFDLPTAEIKGVVFEPAALGRPGMPMVGAKKKMTLDKHRAEFAKAKDPVVKQAEAAIIATMLYEKSKTDSGDTQKQDLTDARQILRDAQAAVGDKVDELTLRLLGSYEISLEDWGAAEKAWSALVTLAPKDKEAPQNKAWLAYSLLKQSKNGDALGAVKDEPLTDKQPELAYIVAWAKFRTGDLPGAWAAMLVAEKGWGQNANRDVLDLESLMFAARCNIPLAQAVKDLTPVLAPGGSKDLLAKLYIDLGLKSYQFAGRWADGIAALDKGLGINSKTLAADAVPVIRFQQASYALRLDDPAGAATYSKQSLDTMPKDFKATDDIVDNISALAYIMYLTYATANDDRYYQPAHDVYDVVVPLIASNEKREKVIKDKIQLEQWKKQHTKKPTDGTHNADVIGALLKQHNQEIQACYEQFLTANPKLGGTLTLRLESDQTGVIKGASTEPKAGAEGVPAVAGCVADHAKGWKLPKIANGTGPARSTRIKATYSLAQRKP